MGLDKDFRKFETFDLKEGEEYIPSTSDNNYNNPETGNEDFLVGYHTGDQDTLSGKNEFKIRLQDARGIYYGTTEYWAENPRIPKEGDIYIYTDAVVTDKDGNEITMPQMKIGTGNAYLANLRFVGQAIMQKLDQHIADTGVHLQPGEREYWNSKIDIDPDNAVEDETLLITRHREQLT